jgi:hypothetical protein
MAVLGHPDLAIQRSVVLWGWPGHAPYLIHTSPERLIPSIIVINRA